MASLVGNNKPDNRAKVLFVLKVPPPLHGSTYMNKLVAESNLLHTAFNSRIIPMRFSDSVEAIGKVQGGKIIKWLGFAATLLKYLVVFKPRLVYFALSPFGAAFYKDAAMVAFIKLFRVQVVFHLHGRGIGEAAKKNALNGMLYRFVFRRARVICLSGLAATDLEGVYAGPVDIIPNGVPDEAGSGVLASKPKNRVPNLLYLSNLMEAKGVTDFVKALGILKRQGIAFRANIVGQPKDVTATALEQLISDLNLTGQVLLQGGKYGFEKQQLLLESDVFVFPTRYKNEAFPLVLLEAMQYGLAVVATRWAAIPEILDEGRAGLLTTPADISGIAQALATLIQNPDLRVKMQEAGRTRYQALYTLSAFESNLKDTLNRIINT